jgi:hypothetical protein
MLISIQESEEDSDLESNIKVKGKSSVILNISISSHKFIFSFIQTFLLSLKFVLTNSDDAEKDESYFHNKIEPQQSSSSRDVIKRQLQKSGNRTNNKSLSLVILILMEIFKNFDTPNFMLWESFLT